MTQLENTSNEHYIEIIPTEEEALYLAENIKEKNERTIFIKNALRAKTLLEDYATIYVEKDSTGKVTAAASVIYNNGKNDYEETSYLQSTPPHKIISYFGALGNGAGSRLLKRIQEDCKKEKISLYLEPTDNAVAFWIDKKKARIDPDYCGSEYHGWSYS